MDTDFVVRVDTSNSVISNEFKDFVHYYYDSVLAHPYDMPRDVARKRRKRRRRVIVIRSKVTFMLLKCKADFLKQLSPKELVMFRASVQKVLFEAYDYYPIPKVLNNKLRRYVHDNPAGPDDITLAGSTCDWLTQ